MSNKLDHISPDKFTEIISGKDKSYLKHLPVTKETILIEEKVIDGHIKIDNTFKSAYSVQIKNCVLNGPIWIEGGEFNHPVSINNIQGQNGFISFIGGNYHNPLSITGEVNCIFTGGTYRSIYVINPIGRIIFQFEEDILLALNTILFHFEKDNMCNIIFNCIAKRNIWNKLDSDNYHLIENIEISDLNNKTNLSMHDISFNHLTLKGNIKGGLTISGLASTSSDVQKSISFKNGNLGSTQLLNCNFFNYKLVINDYIFSNATFINTILPSFDEIRNENKSFLNQKSIFGQLKNTFKNGGDNIKYYEFRAAEMNSYYRLISLWRNPGDKITLFFNKWTNNFGVSWGRSIISLITTTIVLYYIFLFNLEFTVNRNNFLDVFYLYFEFINPLHKRDLFMESLAIGEGTYKPSSIAIENISRVIISFLLYQFLVSFRKFRAL